ncbi:hypothetical protein BJ170DRAFT_160824 [Xylariales sp. AK1849]|nr:hypothetical protein BJ170DRAFT_160824 [Xylariales sp. AK1849]
MAQVKSSSDESGSAAREPDGAETIDAGRAEAGADEFDDGIEESSSVAHDSESSSEGTTKFLDLEASEGEEVDTYEPEWPFPQFMRLPIELRQRMWAFFDPYMTAPSRIFNFRLVRGANRRFQAWEGGTLDEQTRPARTVLATHAESRAVALRFYHDEATFRDGYAIIRCTKEKDIMLIDGYRLIYQGQHWESQIGLLDGVKHLGLSVDEGAQLSLTMVNSLHPPTFQSLPELKSIYFNSDASRWAANEIRWCIDESANNFYVRTEEVEPGLGEDLEFMFCWPQANNDPEPDSTGDHLSEMEDDEIPNITVIELPNERKIYPMIQFWFEGGIQRFTRIKAASVAEGGWESNYFSSEDGESVESRENEYESEGIDDEPIDEVGEASEVDDDLLVQTLSDDEQQHNLGGFSPLQVDPNDGGFSPVVLSSTGSTSPAARDASSTVSAEPSTGGARRSKHRVVVDSDDENEDEDEEVSVPARPAARRRRRVLPESDDEDDEDDRDFKPQPRIVEASSESESDSDSELDSEGKDEESSKEETRPRNMTLAERIGLFRSENPVDGSASDADQSSDEDNNGDDEHFHAGFQDDDDGAEGSENDLILDTAEEGSEDEVEW